MNKSTIADKLLSDPMACGEPDATLWKAIMKFENAVMIIRDLASDKKLSPEAEWFCAGFNSCAKELRLMLSTATKPDAGSASSNGGKND